MTSRIDRLRKMAILYEARRDEAKAVDDTVVADKMDIAAKRSWSEYWNQGGGRDED